MLRAPTLALFALLAAVPAANAQGYYGYEGYAQPVPQPVYNQWYGGQGGGYPAPPPARQVIQPNGGYNGYYVPNSGYAPQNRGYQQQYQYNPYQYGTEPQAAPRPQRPATQQTAKRRGPAPEFMRTVVTYTGSETPGTIVVDTPSRYLYLVQGDGTAIRYGIGVGRPGFEWAGEHKVTSKKEWPTWTPPAEMLERQPDLPRHMAGGPRNPLGARALYLGSTLYRIHGSNEPWSIGHAVSSGCIRMTNDDVIDLYARVPVGARVIVI